jgi:Rrf2 family protein
MSVMQVSRRVDYALRAAIFLSHDSPATLGEIAEHQAIPKKFLEKIVQDLARAGLLKSKRGPDGGYALSRNASDITFKDIIEAVDGPIFLNTCLAETFDCALTPSCGMLPVWQEGQRRVVGLFESTSLADL